MRLPYSILFHLQKKKGCLIHIFQQKITVFPVFPESNKVSSHRKFKMHI